LDKETRERTKKEINNEKGVKERERKINEVK